MQCCGQDRTTKFCADCGRNMKTGHVLADLLSYVLEQIARMSSGMSRDELRAQTDESFAEWHNNSVARCRTQLARWRAWADELEKAIVALAEKEHGTNPTTKTQLPEA